MIIHSTNTIVNYIFACFHKNEKNLESLDFLQFYICSNIFLVG